MVAIEVCNHARTVEDRRWKVPDRRREMVRIVEGLLSDRMSSNCVCDVIIRRVIVNNEVVDSYTRIGLCTWRVRGGFSDLKDTIDTTADPTRKSETVVLFRATSSGRFLQAPISPVRVPGDRITPRDALANLIEAERLLI